jgi:hypothetical protein
MIFAEFSLRSLKDQSSNFDESGPNLACKTGKPNSARSSVGSFPSRSSVPVKDSLWFWTGSSLEAENRRLKQELCQVITWLTRLVKENQELRQKLAFKSD